MLLADQIEDELVRRERAHHQLSGRDFASVVEADSGGGSVLDDRALHLQIGEELAPHLHQELMGGVGDLVGAAAVEADRRKGRRHAHRIDAGSGIVDVDHRRDREAEDAGLELGALEPLLCRAQRAGLHGERVGGEARLDQLGKELRLPLRDLGVGLLLHRPKQHVRSHPHQLVAPGHRPEPPPGVGVLLREACDLLGGALLGGIVLVAVDGEAVLLVLEDEAVAAGVLVPAGSVLPELGEVAPDRRVVPGQDDVGVGVPAEAGRRELLGGEAAADLVPSLEDADAHAAVLDQIEGEQERLVSSAHDHRVEGLVSHRGSSPSRCHSESSRIDAAARETRYRRHDGS